MRIKQLLFLAVVLAVLVAAVVLLKRPPTPAKLAEEVGFERVVPTSLTADAIQGIDLYQGDKQGEAVQLRRQEDRWIAASYHNAPVKTDKVDKLLDGVSGLEGEVRADKEEVLDAFNLQDAQALHVLLYTDKPDEPAAHLLAGKSSGRAEFVRNAKQNRVYSVNLDLRSEAGLYGDETDKVPEAKPWLNLQLHDVPEKQVTGVELQMPERRLRLTLNKPAPEKTAEAEKSEDGKAPSIEAKADKPEASEAKPEAKPEWVLVEPKVNYPLKQGVVEGLVSTLRTLRGDDVVAPDKISEYGLDNPPYRAELKLEEDGKDPRQVAIAVGNTVSEEDEKRYVHLEQDDSPVYLLPKWTFNQVFPTLGTILTLDVLSLESDDIVGISWEQDGDSLALERQSAADAKTAPDAETGAEKASESESVRTSGEHQSTEPEASKAASGEDQPAEPETKKTGWQWVQTPEIDVDAEKLTTLLDTVERLTADDWFADAPAEAGLEQPTLTLRLTLRNGATYHVAFGQTRGKDEDRYVGVQGKAGTFVVAKTSYKSIHDALQALRPEAPAPAAAPAPGTSSKPDMEVATPKPEMSSPDPAANSASEGTTIALPKPGVVPEASSVIKMPSESPPTPLSVPPAASGAHTTQETPLPPATETPSNPAPQPEGKQ